jgi:uncharacterized protein YndB with AHSA1/START domain
MSRSTQVSQIIKAPRDVIYRAFLEPEALVAWLPPDGMNGHVHTLEAHEGGTFRISLTYQNPEASLGGKTSSDTDTIEGKFIELLSNEKIVWVSEFESEQPEFAGEMRITWSFADTNEGTEVTVLCEDIPEGIRLKDNELGSRSSLRNLATFIERKTKNGF